MTSFLVNGLKARVYQYLPLPTRGNTADIDTVDESCRWETCINHSDFKIFKSHEKQLCEVFLRKFDCYFTIDSPSQLSHTSSQPVFKKMLTAGVELSVWKDDLTTHAVDAVVNAANEYLRHGGGLALALVRAGGYEIQEESRNLVSKRGRVPTGGIGVTGAGRLPCKCIIHAVGPHWTKTDEERCTEQLKGAIINVLDYVCQNLNIKSVAIPAISSGIFQFPLDLCTYIIVETIVVYLQNNQVASNLKEIHLVSNEEPTVKAFTTASEAILGRNDPESWAFSATMAENKPALLTSLSNYSGVPVFHGTGEEKTENGFNGKFPVIIVKGCKERVQEAQAWVSRMLTLQGHHVIENNHILCLGKKEHDILSQLQKTSDVSISEIIDSEKAKLEIKGAQTDLKKVVINIEHLLCHVQAEMAKEKERKLWKLLGRWSDHQPKILEEMSKISMIVKCRKGFSSPALQDRKKEFEKCGLQVVKVEEIKNDLLSTVFQVKKKMMERSTQKEPESHRLFHRVPQQFCREVCSVGFHRMYSEPCDPKYGAGIYFTKNLKNLVDQIKKTASTDTLIYVFEAEVLTGSFCQGCQLNIVPPALSPGVIDSHDSAVDNVFSPETFVIFSGTQAMPVYLWTCTQNV